MKAKGFALVGVLWTIALLGTAVGLSVGAARVGSRAAANRIALLRGRWAADACLGIAAAWWGTPRWRDTVTIDLGRETRCAWHALDATARLDVNRAPREMLERLVDAEGVPSGIAARFLDTVLATRVRRPYRSVAELPSLPGYDGRLPSDLAVEGPGTINVNGANRAVLLALPGFGVEAADRALGARAGGGTIGSLDQLVALLSEAGQRNLTGHYAELAGLITFTPAQVVLSSDGWVGAPGSEPHQTIELVVVPLPDRLAVIRRRVS
jgi:hypothetical protein